eukprot:m.109837 g.109837  ORF g.109837 m.109837 type:complete len:408 (+) comp10699_c0_seq2:570-1793(+)
MAAPVTNAWRRPLTEVLNTTKSTPADSPATHTEEGGHAETNAATGGGAGSDSAAPAATKVTKTAPPITNPWKTPEAGERPKVSLPLPAKKGKAAKSWPALGESVVLEQKKPTTLPAGGAPLDKPASDKPVKSKASGSRKDKWVPYADELPLHHRPRGEGASSSHGRGRGSRRSSSRQGRKGGSKPVSNGDTSIGGVLVGAPGEWPVDAQTGGYLTPPYPTGGVLDASAVAASAFYAYPDAAAAATVAPAAAAAAAYGGFVPEFPMMGLAPTVVPPLPAAILYQVEYYMSVDNLVRDSYLRDQMDAQGWVPLAHLANFKRLASLTRDVSEIAASLTASTTLEVKDDAYVRRQQDWQKFLPPVPRSSLTPMSANPPPSPSPSTATSRSSPESVQSTSFNVKAREFVPGR